MKKTIKTTAMAIALMAAVSGAFASDIANAISGKIQTQYRWVKYNRDQTIDTGTPAVVSTTNPFTECTGEEENCAIGTNLANPEEQIIVKYEELP